MQLKNSKVTNMEAWKKNIREVRQRALEEQRAVEETAGCRGDRGSQRGQRAIEGVEGGRGVEGCRKGRGRGNFMRLTFV